MTELVTRAARPDERAAIARLTWQAYAEYERIMAPSAWAALEHAIASGLEAERGVERIVAVQDDELVGSVLLYGAATNAYADSLPDLEWPEVRLLSVPPAHRGRGVAIALLNECVRRARQAGAAALGLHTSISMRAAIRLYEQMGFVRAPEHDFQPPGAERVEAYRLDL
jgi:GNAT superfamily N-acetyltransferase